MLLAKETTHCSAKAFQICTLEYVVIGGIKAERIHPLKTLAFLDEGDKEQEELCREIIQTCPFCPSALGFHKRKDARTGF